MGKRSDYARDGQGWNRRFCNLARYIINAEQLSFIC